MNTNEALHATRTDLVDQVFGSYNPEHFPGSKGWRITRKLQNELDDFDAEHPEIVTKITEQRQAKDKQAADDAGWF